MHKKFKVLAGKHIQDNKVYLKGDVVISSRDLKEDFKNKFEYLGDVPVDEVPVEKSESNQETDPSIQISGTDVTSDFASEDDGVIVMKQGAWHNIYNAITKEKLNDTGMKAEDVPDWIDDYLSSEE